MYKCVSFLLACALLGCLPCDAAAAAAQKPRQSTRVVRRERLIRYSLDTYGKTLGSNKWIVRSMAVLGLAQIDDPRVTELLLEVLTRPYSSFARAAKRRRAAGVAGSLGDTKVQGALGGRLSAGGGSRMGDYIVQVMAWEALHARNPSLSGAQRGRWIESTVKLARAGQFRGVMRASMLRLLTPRGATDENVRIFSDLFKRTNSLYPSDGPVLIAMREALTAWRNPRLVKSLIQAVGGNINDAVRADYLLRGFASNVPPLRVQSTENSASTLRRAQKRWVAWFAGQDMTGKSPAMKAYYGTSTLIPTAEVVKNPDDRKWLDGLEIGDLRRSQLDVCFVVDSTGSMKDVVEWIKRDVRKMMTALGLVGRYPRASVVFYRDKGDAYVTQLYPLTSNGQRLTRAIARATAHGGGDVPEAVYDGLYTARYKQEWSAGKKGYRAIILIGDAPPHKRDMKRISKLIASSLKKGFVFHCIKARTQYGGGNLDSFDQIARWAGGKSVWVNFTNSSLFHDIYSGARNVHVAVSQAAAGDDTLIRPDRIIVRAVMKGILSQSYRRHVDSFANVLLEYLETPIAEKRLPVLPVKPPRNNRRVGRKKKDKGVQDR